MALNLVLVVTLLGLLSVKTGYCTGNVTAMSCYQCGVDPNPPLQYYSAPNTNSSCAIIPLDLQPVACANPNTAGCVVVTITGPDSRKTYVRRCADVADTTNNHCLGLAAGSNGTAPTNRTCEICLNSDCNNATYPISALADSSHDQITTSPKISAAVPRSDNSTTSSSSFLEASVVSTLFAILAQIVRAFPDVCH